MQLSTKQWAAPKISRGRVRSSPSVQPIVRAAYYTEQRNFSLLLRAKQLKAVCHWRAPHLWPARKFLIQWLVLRSAGRCRVLRKVRFTNRDWEL